MKIHLRQIPEDGLHLEGEEDYDILELNDSQPVKRVSPLRYSLDIGKNSDGLWITGQLSLDLELQCVRCLESLVYPLTVSDLAVQMELPTLETVDLTPYLREDILLALPAYPRCDWSGERVCPGEEFVVAAHQQETVDAGDNQPLPPSAWATLDQLKDPSTR